MVSALASINEVNLRRARLVLKRVTVFGFNFRCRSFISVCNQPATQTQPSIPPGSVNLNEYQLRLVLERQLKAGIVHSVNGWTQGVQVKQWDPLRTRAILEHLKSVFTTRRYTNPRLPLHLPLPFRSKTPPFRVFFNFVCHVKIRASLRCGTVASCKNSNALTDINWSFVHITWHRYSATASCQGTLRNRLFIFSVIDASP